MLSWSDNTLKLANTSPQIADADWYVNKITYDLFPVLREKFNLEDLDEIEPISGGTSACIWKSSDVVIKIYFDHTYFIREVMAHLLQHRLNPSKTYPVVIAGNGILLLPYLGETSLMDINSTANLFSSYYQKARVLDDGWEVCEEKIHRIKTLSEIVKSLDSVLPKKSFLELYTAPILLSQKDSHVSSSLSWLESYSSLDGIDYQAYDLLLFMEERVERSLKWNKPEYEVPDSIFDNAKKCFSYLNEVSSPHLILGDASKMNIMEKDGKYNLIDILPIVGDPCYDLACYIYKLRLGEEKMLETYDELAATHPTEVIQKTVAFLTLIAADNLVSSLHHKRTKPSDARPLKRALKTLQGRSGLVQKLDLH